jgi:tyrosine-protein kinase Etk/Wzc
MAVDPNLPLAQLVGTMLESRRLILGTTLATFALGVLYAVLATPIYRADALVQVEEKTQGIAGLEDAPPPTEPLANPADTEIEILRSRSLVGQVVKELSLDVVARPRFFPVVGAALARSHRGPDPARAPLGLSSFAWGGERIGVEHLTVPPELERARLRLVAQDDGRYTLLGPDGEELLTGVVGKAASGRAGTVSVFVSELRARPGTGFVLEKRPEPEVIEELQGNLVIGEKRRRTGIVRMELSGPDAGRLVETLDALSAGYVRQNVERRSGEAEKRLQFITSQLPAVKAQLDASEEALNRYRSTHGTIDVPLENKAAIEESAAIEKLDTELQLQRAELAQRFTSSHPFVAALRKKQAELDSQREALNARIKSLPEAELSSLRLLRDVKVSNELYVLLLNKAQELSVVKSGTLGNVRILDPAQALAKPVHPARGRTLALSLVLGLALGVTTAFARRALVRGVEDPDAVEAATGLPVLASVPHSEAQARRGRAAHGSDAEGERGVLAALDPDDLAVESVRGLRTWLEFALTDASGRIIAIGAPGRAAGTAFVASNLAQVLADGGRRVLLVDGDLRDGHLHQAVGLGSSPGLTDVIAGGDLAASLHHLSDRLDLLPAGPGAPHPSEMLMSARFRELIGRAGREYELVVIATPPILAVTDAAIISRLASATLLVLRAGRHPVREVVAAQKRYAQSGVKPAGLVVNDVRRGAAVVHGRPIEDGPGKV